MTALFCDEDWPKVLYKGDVIIGFYTGTSDNKNLYFFDKEEKE